MTEVFIVEKKPVRVEAVHFSGGLDSAIEVCRWIDITGGRSSWDSGVTDAYDPETKKQFSTPEELKIHTLEGVMTAKPGDWIIRGIQGEFYPCKPDIFVASYVVVPKKDI